MWVYTLWKDGEEEVVERESLPAKTAEMEKVVEVAEQTCFRCLRWNGPRWGCELALCGCA